MFWLDNATLLAIDIEFVGVENFFSSEKECSEAFQKFCNTKVYDILSPDFDLSLLPTFEFRLQIL